MKLNKEVLQKMEDYQYGRLRLKSIAKEIETAQEMLELLKSFQIEVAPESFEAVNGYLNQLKIERAELSYKNHFVDDAIAALPKKQQLLVKRRYVGRWKWDNIASQMHMGLTKCKELHCDALDKIGEYLEKTVPQDME